jgi:hypothetical protein
MVRSLKHLPFPSRQSLVARIFQHKFMRQLSQEVFCDDVVDRPGNQDICRILRTVPIAPRAFGVIAATIITNLHRLELIASDGIRLSQGDRDVVEMLIDSVYTLVPIVAFLSTGKIRIEYAARRYRRRLSESSRQKVYSLSNFHTSRIDRAIQTSKTSLTFLKPWTAPSGFSCPICRGDAIRRMRCRLFCVTTPLTVKNHDFPLDCEGDVIAWNDIAGQWQTVGMLKCLTIVCKTLKCLSVLSVHLLIQNMVVPVKSIVNRSASQKARSVIQLWSLPLFGVTFTP